MVGPGERSRAEPAAEAADALARLVEAGARARAAAAVVAELTGTTPNAVYRAYTQRGSIDPGADR